ncbi:hypothetical protein HCZ23_13365 [Celeribacter sp. HF31]|uniref:hypothetical protein n=1 Tax=Celeribacter sp. HF31 TaxID=2721558 RepID=UPI0014306459|nr:hypothetical protein [Celeribacter sp. HF31]NIY80449.1 hypothetical protein [Celeribacter sp. HF31]
MIFLCFLYLLLCLTLYFGFPPFYGTCIFLRPVQVAMNRTPPLPTLAIASEVAIFALVLISSMPQLSFVRWLAPIFALVGVISIRRAMKHQGRDRSLWFLNRLSARYPLWLFDLWSLGLTLLFGLLFLLS